MQECSTIKVEVSTVNILNGWEEKKIMFKS